MKMEIIFNRKTCKDAVGIAIYNLMGNIHNIMFNLYKEWSIERIDIEVSENLLTIKVLIERTC